MTSVEIKASILANIDDLKIDQYAMPLFRFQYKNNSVYKAYVDALGKSLEEIVNPSQIPYLPISAFKKHKVLSVPFTNQKAFESSGTTSSTTSKHYVRDIDFYHQIAVNLFEADYGDLKDYCILALLPSYLERDNSSLVSMVDHFIKESGNPLSGFYLNTTDALIEVLKENNKNEIKTLLIGVSFALLDLVNEFQGLDFSNITFMETGGMKGRYKEIPRSALHQLLIEGFNVESIHSEYGMTELLSQAYSKGQGLFTPSKTMSVSITEITDPMQTLPEGKTGLIRIMDIANVESCSFILTEDLGRIDATGNFEVLGRVDNSDIRGCNLLYV